MRSTDDLDEQHIPAVEAAEIGEHEEDGYVQLVDFADACPSRDIGGHQAEEVAKLVRREAYHEAEQHGAAILGGVFVWFGSVFRVED